MGPEAKLAFRIGGAPPTEFLSSFGGLEPRAILQLQADKRRELESQVQKAGAVLMALGAGFGKEVSHKPSLKGSAESCVVPLFVAYVATLRSQQSWGGERSAGAVGVF